MPILVKDANTTLLGLCQLRADVLNKRLISAVDLLLGYGGIIEYVL